MYLYSKTNRKKTWTYIRTWNDLANNVIYDYMYVFGGAVLCDIPKAVSSLTHHRMRQKKWLTVDGYRLNSCSHREQGLWKEPFCDRWGSELSIIALQEAESGLKQCAVYHYIASLGDGTADTDGWLTMTVHDGGFNHTAQKAEHISKGSVLALYSGGWSFKRLFLYGSAALPWFLVSWTYLPMLVQSPTSPGEKRETI